MTTPGGYDYYVSDEQLAEFAKLTPLERLRWLDELRLFTLMAGTPEATERRKRLRRGQTIVPEDGETLVPGEQAGAIGA